MKPLVDQWQGWLRGSVKFEDSKGLVRPEDLFAGNAPAETSGVTQPLCLRKVPFAAPLFLGHPLLLSDIHPSADVACNHALLVNRSAHFAQHSDLAIGPDDPVLAAINLACGRDPLRIPQKLLPVLGMHERHELGESHRTPLSRVEPENLERDGRPLLYQVGEFERPASHPGEPLRLSHVPLAQPQRIVSPSPVLDIDTSAVPSNDVSA